MRRLLALVALVAAALLTGALPSAALVENPTPVRFVGTVSGFAFSTGGGDLYAPTAYGPNAATVDFDCLDGECVVVGIIVNDRESTSLSALRLVDGAGTWSTPVACGDPEKRATNGTATLEGTTLTIFERYEEMVEGECPPLLGSGANENNWVLELVDGDLCVFDDSCVTADEPASSVDEDCCAPPGLPRAFAEPTVFSGLATAAEAATPGNLVWAAVGTVILALLIAIPTHFFNNAAETLSERIGAWWHRRRGRADAVPSRGLVGWPWAAGGVLAAAVLSVFADPAFAFDAAGFRVLVSIAASFALEVVLGWVAVILIVRRTHPTASATVRFAPLTLLLVAAAVLLTRLTGFEPPIVFGLVAGVAFGGLLATAEKARVALIGLGWSFGVGLLAWILYSLLPVDAVVVRELLSAASIAGLSTLPIALLPLRGLAGRTVWDADRRVWIAAYAVGLFAFLLVLLPLPSSWAQVSVGLWTWVGLYLLYALVAVGIWLVVSRPWRRGAEAGA